VDTLAARADIDGLPPNHDAQHPVAVPVTWAELLRTSDRALRRMLVERYRDALNVDQLTRSVLSDRGVVTAMAEARRHQLQAMLDVEQQRLQLAAEARYAQMARDYSQRIRHQRRKGGPRGAWKRAMT
jgi:hypothetical protein